MEEDENGIIKIARPRPEILRNRWYCERNIKREWFEYDVVQQLIAGLLSSAM